ncbi:MAG: amidohydrolase, partial [Actinomycetota bacterium]
MTTVFVARTIITLDPVCPRATAVAVRDGRILHVGSLPDIEQYLDGVAYRIDRTYEDAVLTPGFIEAHGHLFGNGSVCAYPWVGFDDRQRPDGTIDQGCTTIAAVLERLQAEVGRAIESETTLLGFGFDPTFHDGRSLTAADLDQVSEHVGVIVMNASGHLAYANSAHMARNGITRDSVVAGVMTNDDGTPNGIFHETAMSLLFAKAEITGANPTEATWNGGRLAALAGCTTMTDLAIVAVGESFETFRREASTADFPVRVIYAPSVNEMKRLMTLEQLLESAEILREQSNERCSLGPLKWIADGSIQGFTGKLKWPGYCSGEDHGFLILDEETVVEEVLPFHEAGFQAAIHTNGDEATEVVLRALERILIAAPRPDHRHRLEHCQLASRAHFQKMAKLGVCVNLFSNHLFYWGDTHRTKTVGPDKARRMNAAATAKDCGVSFSVHSDAPVTPVGPLFTMWCAVNRETRTGFVLGEQERLSPMDALEAVTIGAAILLKRENDLGTIEVGKFADFTVLADDPLEVDRHVLKDIAVLGTIV